MALIAIAIALSWMPIPVQQTGAIRFSLPSDVPSVLSSAPRTGSAAARPASSGLIPVPDSAPPRAPDQPAVSSIPGYELVGPRREEPLPPGVIAYSEGVIRAADRRYSITFLHGPNWRPWLNPSQVYLPGRHHPRPGPGAHPAPAR